MDDVDAMIDELHDADLPFWGEMCAVATNMLAGGWEIEEIGDELADEYGIERRHGITLAWLMSDESSEHFA